MYIDSVDNTYIKQRSFLPQDVLRLCSDGHIVEGYDILQRYPFYKAHDKVH